MFLVILDLLREHEQESNDSVHRNGDFKTTTYTTVILDSTRTPAWAVLAQTVHTRCLRRETKTIAGNIQINRSNGPKAVSRSAISEHKYASDVPLDC
jgi:hypothetical protein